MIRKVFHIIFVTLVLLTFSLTSESQTGEITISSAEGCQGDIVDIPVIATDLLNIGAITLYIDYNPDSFDFDTIVNINPALNGLLFNDIEQVPGTFPGGKIAISWSGFSSVDLANDNLFTMSFIYHGQNDSIIFSSNNEIADFEANILTVNYNNSAISLSEEVTISLQPNDLSIMTNESGSFVIDGSNIDNFNWEYNNNGTWISIQNSSVFSGQSTNTLNINSPDISLNGVYFRCMAIGCNSLYTDSVQLFVQPDIIANTERNRLMTVFPNPAKNFINITINGISGNCDLLLYKQSSVISKNVNINTPANLTIDTEQLSSGVYFILLSKDNKIQFQKKIIIIE